MALARVKIFSAGEVLASSDLNSEFQNLIDNARDLISPLTASLDMNGFELVLDADADTSITADTDDRLDVRLGGVDLFILNGTVASPVNGLQFIAGASGTRAVIDSGITGADANVGFTLLASGTGPVCIDNDTDPVDLRFLGAAGANNKITDVNGNEIVILAGTASAVNEITVTNNSTGANPHISATGETNVGLELRPKGTGNVTATDGTDVTKKLALVLSGITTGTTRTLTMPNENVTLAAATETARGTIELATNAEALGGVDTTRAVTSAGLASAQNSGADGYLKFPGGIIMQWGAIATDVNGDATFTYPVAFATAARVCFAIDKSGDNGRTATCASTGTTTAWNVFTVDAAGVAVSSQLFVLVIGI